MARRSRAREAALRVLYQFDVTKEPVDEVLEYYWAEFPLPDDLRAYAEELVRGVIERRAELDSSLSWASVHWSLERMSSIDRNILRVALYEMRYREDVPPKVAMDEAIELAKKYGSEGSPAFINGVLDALHRPAGNSPED